MKILIVDDNEDNRKLQLKQFSALGHDVAMAANGKEALSKALENTPDVMVTDILMPEMDGYELCKEWKSNPGLKQIPLIFYTATYTSDQDEKFARSLGVDAFLRKPVGIDLLMETITQATARARAGQVNRPAVESLQLLDYLSEHNKVLLSKLLKKVEQLETDMSERKQAEEALRESEEKFRQFFENAQVYCYMVSPDDVLMEINNAACQALGYQKDELIGLPYTLIYAPEYRPRVREIIDEWSNTGVIKSEEVVIIARTGERRDVLISVGSIRDKNGKLKSSVLIQRDITELKSSQAKAMQVETLTRLNTAKSELLSNVVHELRTPLQSIKGFIETLIEPDVKWSKKQQLEFLVEANKEVDVLDRLIRDLLDISRIESGKLKLARQYVSLDDILESIKSRLAILTERHKLELDFAVGLPPIHVDRLRIAQVITNLVENATKFSPAGSTITISARVQDNQITIRVRDQGIGISQETIDKLFDRFFQAENKVSSSTKGTGLGLSICRGIVEAHEGKIRVESVPGNGAAFIFSLPFSPPEQKN